MGWNGTGGMEKLLEEANGGLGSDLRGASEFGGEQTVLDGCQRKEMIQLEGVLGDQKGGDQWICRGQKGRILMDVEMVEDLQLGDLD